MTKLMGVGAALVDRLARVPDNFLETITGAKGGMELIEYPLMQEICARLPRPPEEAPGGSAANTVMSFARLGGAAGMLAKTGDDEPGEFYCHEFERHGVDVSGFKTADSQPTGACLSLITPDSQRTMRTFLGAAATLTPEEIVLSDFEGYSHLHLEGYLLFNRELMTRVLKLARQAKCRVSLDLGAPEVVSAAVDILPEILADYVDTVFANEDEAEAYSGSVTPEDGLDKLSEVCSSVAVKLGPKGALIRSGGESALVPALRVDSVDTTGAGDLWAAGFLYGALHEWPLHRAGELGARLGAEVVQTVGTTLTDKTWAGIRRDFNIKKADE